MVILEYPCSDCSGVCTVLFIERCMHGYIILSESTRCSNCDFALEADGHGKLPDDIRKLQIEQEGHWGLKIHSGKKVVIGKVIRALESLTLKEVSILLKKIPGIISTGTQAEMERIKYWLDHENNPIDSSIVSLVKGTESDSQFFESHS